MVNLRSPEIAARFHCAGRSGTAHIPGTFAQLLLQPLLIDSATPVATTPVSAAPAGIPPVAAPVAAPVPLIASLPGVGIHPMGVVGLLTLANAFVLGGCGSLSVTLIQGLSQRAGFAPDQLLETGLGALAVFVVIGGEIGRCRARR